MPGQAANLLAGRRAFGDVGAFTLAGQAAGTLAGRGLAGAVGTFALAGQDAGVLAGRRVVGAVGAFVLGQASDILSSASFESGWDGFKNGSGLDPSGDIVRSTDRAYLGATSLKVAWTVGGPEVNSQCFYDLGAGQTHLWMRTRFYIDTAWPDGGGFKFFRVQDAGFSKVTGIQTANGNLAILTNDGRIVYCGTEPSVGSWHTLEWEYDTVNKLIRVWVDGVLKTLTIYSDPGGLMSLVEGNTALSYGTADVASPRHLDCLRVVNDLCSTAGAAYLDDISVNTTGPVGDTNTRLLAGRKVAGAVGTFVLAGQDATLTFTGASGYSLVAAVGAFVLAGQAAGLLAARRLPGDVGAFTFTGQPAGLVGPGAKVLVAAAGAFTFNGLSASPVSGRLLAADLGVITLTGAGALLNEGVWAEGRPSVAASVWAEGRPSVAGSSWS